MTPPPPLPRQNPSPAPNETDNGGSSLLGPSDIAQLMLMMRANTQLMQQMKDEMKTNLKENTNEMKEEISGMNNKMEAKQTE